MRISDSSYNQTPISGPVGPVDPKDVDKFKKNYDIALQDLKDLLKTAPPYNAETRTKINNALAKIVGIGNLPQDLKDKVDIDKLKVLSDADLEALMQEIADKAPPHI